MRWEIITMVFVLAATRVAMPAVPASGGGSPASSIALTKSITSQVPADTRWIIYLNFDQAMKTPDAGKLLYQFLNSHPSAKSTIGKVETILGNKFPDDFHQILIMGRQVGPGHGVVVMHATAAQSHISQLIALNSAASTMTVGKTRVNMIPSSDSKGYTTFEASPEQGTFVVSRSEHAIADELHVLTGKSNGMTMNNPLLVGLHQKAIIYVADTDIAQLANRPGRHHGPGWMKSVTGAWMALQEKNNKIDVKGRIALINAESAARIVQIAQGWQAAMDLGATSAHANPHQIFMAGLADRLNVGAIGKVISFHWTMSLAKLLAGPRKPTTAAE
ncbi:MAG: hypothetical protein M0Z50_09950 [Planctomycetia bacterium]|nr:hypothetical protein [Planctomycetia bacterium]